MTERVSDKSSPCCGEFLTCQRPCTPRGTNEAMQRVERMLRTASTSLPPEFAKVVNDNFWALLHGHPEPATPPPEVPPKPRSGYQPMTEEEIEMIRAVLGDGTYTAQERKDIGTLCDMANSSLLYAEELHRIANAPPSATRRTWHRLAAWDKRIAHGDDFAGDAWFCYTAVGHHPDHAPTDGTHSGG